MPRRSLISVLPLIVLLSLLSASFYPTSVSGIALAQTPPATLAATASAAFLAWLKVFFTDPNPPDNVGHGVDNIVVPVLDAAKQSIDLTSFDFTLPSVTASLINAKKRGVTVRVVFDEANGIQLLKASETTTKQEFNALKTLQDVGISVVNSGRSNGLMHNKIILVDSTTLFMGSWNMSYSDTFRNNNNLLQITSQRLIANYQAKFNELFVDKRFGTKATVGAQTPKLTLDGVPVENYFPPVDHVMDKIVTEVKAAQHSIKFMAFTYTDKRLSDAMIAQAKAGIAVQGVIENRGASEGALTPLVCAGLPVEVERV